MKKELFIYFFILVVLTLLVHYEAFLSNPLTQIVNLPNSGAYGLEGLHPFVFTLVVYILLWIPRLIGKVFKSK